VQRVGSSKRAKSLARVFPEDPIDLTGRKVRAVQQNLHAQVAWTDMLSLRP